MFNFLLSQNWYQLYGPVWERTYWSEAAGRVQACPLVFNLLLRRATANVPLSVSSRASCGLINFEDNDQESMASIRRGWTPPVGQWREREGERVSVAVYERFLSPRSQCQSCPGDRWVTRRAGRLAEALLCRLDKHTGWASRFTSR